MALLEVQDVKKVYGRKGQIQAIKRLSLAIEPGTSVGIAGESGSGKSTLLKLLLELEVPSEGRVLFEGKNLEELTREERLRYRSSVQAVFQDPGSSLDPRHRIWRSITEPFSVGRRVSKTDRQALAASLLKRVDLPRDAMFRYPHQLSGGERQRVAIARALSSDPSVILLDEPVTSLDISLRGHIINLLNETARETGLTYAVVSHDLTAIYHLTDYLIIMRHGEVIEAGPTVDVIANPIHPYTRRLVVAVGDPRLAANVPEAIDDPANPRERRELPGGGWVLATADEFAAAAREG